MIFSINNQPKIFNIRHSVELADAILMLLKSIRQFSNSQGSQKYLILVPNNLAKETLQSLTDNLDGRFRILSHYQFYKKLYGYWHRHFLSLDTSERTNLPPRLLSYCQHIGDLPFKVIVNKALTSISSKKITDDGLKNIHRATYEYYHYGLTPKDLIAYTNDQEFFLQLATALDDEMRKRNFITRSGIVFALSVYSEKCPRSAEIIAKLVQKKFGNILQFLPSNITPINLTIHHWLYKVCDATTIVRGYDQCNQRQHRLSHNHPQTYLLKALEGTFFGPNKRNAATNFEISTKLQSVLKQHVIDLAQPSLQELHIQSLFHAGLDSATEQQPGLPINSLRADKLSGSLDNTELPPYSIYEADNVISEASLVIEKVFASKAKKIGIITKAPSLATLILEELEKISNPDYEISHSMTTEWSNSIDLFQVVLHYLNGDEERLIDIIYHPLVSINFPQKELWNLASQCHKRYLELRNGIPQILSEEHDINGNNPTPSDENDYIAVKNLYSQLHEKKGQMAAGNVPDLYEQHMSLCRSIASDIDYKEMEGIEEKLDSLANPTFSGCISLSQYTILFRGCIKQLERQKRQLCLNKPAATSEPTPSDQDNINLDANLDSLTEQQTGGKVQIDIKSFIDSRFEYYEEVILCGMQQDCFPGSISDHHYISSSTRHSKKYPSPTLNELSYHNHDLYRLLAMGRYPTTITYSSVNYSDLTKIGMMSLPLNLLRTNVQHYSPTTTSNSEHVARSPLPPPSPPLEMRPTNLSPSSIKKLIQNPYLYYLEEILKLKPEEDPVGSIQKQFGILIHNLIAETVPQLQQEIRNLLCADNPESPKTLQTKYVESFTDIARKRCYNSSNTRELWPLWSGQIPTIARNVFIDNVEQEKTYLSSMRKGRTFFEKWSAVSLILVNNHKVKLNARFDRIDIIPVIGEDHHTLVIITDYKTGELPTMTDPLGQLHIEAFIAMCNLSSHEMQLIDNSTITFEENAMIEHISGKQGIQIVLRYMQVSKQRSEKSIVFNPEKTYKALEELLHSYYIDLIPYHPSEDLGYTKGFEYLLSLHLPEKE